MRFFLIFTMATAFSASVGAQTSENPRPPREAPADWIIDEGPSPLALPLGVAPAEPTTTTVLSEWQDDPTSSARLRFLAAAIMGDDALIKNLIANGADINEVSPPYGYTILHQAVLTNFTTAVTTLLRNGADPNLTAGNSRPLYDSIDPANLDVFKALLEGGADPNLPENVYTASPLHAAVMDNLTTQAQLLLKYGGNPNQLNGQGVAPLHLAVSLKRVELTRMFLEAGADPNQPTQLGTTPLKIADRFPQTPLRDLLLEFGARP